MNTKELYYGSVTTLRGRSGALTTGITNLNELYSLITYQGLTSLYLVHPISIVSNSAADASAGTGAQQVEICGLDGDYNIQTEIITLTGTTLVASTKYWLRIFSAQVIRCGSGMTNAGTIIVWKNGIGTAPGGVPDAAALAVAWLKMLPGFSAATSGLFTIPKGKTYELANITVSARTQISDLYIVSQTTGVQEVQTLTLTSAPTADGNITVQLDGTPAVTTAVVGVGVGAQSMTTVAANIASKRYYGWTAVAVGPVVTFTSNVGIIRTGANVLAVAATGVVGAFVETLAGTSNPYQTEFAIGISNNTVNVPLPVQNDFKWTEKTDIYLRALSTTAAGVVSANLILRPLVRYS